MPIHRFFFSWMRDRFKCELKSAPLKRVKTKGSAKRGSTICRNASWRHRRRWWDSRVDRQRVGDPDEDHADARAYRQQVIATSHLSVLATKWHRKRIQLVIQSSPPWNIESIKTMNWIDHLKETYNIHACIDMIKN